MIMSSTLRNIITGFSRRAFSTQFTENMASKPPIVVPAVKNHNATIIFAHGLGDSGAGWLSLAQNWRRRGKFDEVKFIFPNAPSIPITVNGGYRMPGWFDIIDFSDLTATQDAAGIMKTRDYFVELIDSEVSSASIPSTRIILGGFSQGGIMSLFTGLTMKTKIGGVVGLSSYLPLQEVVKEQSAEVRETNLKTPIFMGHGDEDPIVKYEWGQISSEIIRSLGYNVDFRTYEGLEHSAAMEEIDDLEAFITKALSAESSATDASTSSSATETKVGHPGL